MKPDKLQLTELLRFTFSCQLTSSASFMSFMCFPWSVQGLVWVRSKDGLKEQGAAAQLVFPDRQAEMWKQSRGSAVFAVPARISANSILESYHLFPAKWKPPLKGFPFIWTNSAVIFIVFDTGEDEVFLCSSSRDTDFKIFGQNSGHQCCSTEERSWCLLWCISLRAVSPALPSL